MNIDIITNSITDYIDIRFAESLDIIDNNSDFIDAHNLIQPKKNYLLTLDYLNTTIKHFTSLDYTFYDKTLKKLHRDINSIYKLYDSLKKDEDEIKKIFDKRFFSKLNLFIEIEENLDYLEESSDINSDKRKMIKLIKSHYKAMYDIYFKIFQEEYLAQNKYVLSSIEEILNSKIFYLDHFLWMEGPKSGAISRTLKMLRLDANINSKKYLLHRLGVALPYTQDYQYLKKCLRVHT
ncbi:hypothetical protein [Sulfurimonas sp.]|uniref:hypothetical protein n=1 Tax=Sulfurimonas sp. TaxID=2022749 RepID=UPI002AB27F66|nr:hypothetical protein [Sulfurimonas sp.]